MDWPVCKTCKNMGTTTGICNSCTKRYSEYVPNHKKPQTNADKYFRNATDEELAERLSKQNFWNCPPHDKTCPGYCRECWLSWLKQEVSE